MSENKRLSETDVVINDKSQGSVAGVVGFSVITVLQIYC